MPLHSTGLAARNSVVERLVAKLASGDYEEVIRLAPGSRVSAEQLAAAVVDYGRRLQPLPSHALALIDYVAVRQSSSPAWSVVVPLFTLEEGRSDLSLELSMAEVEAGTYEVQIDDIHVL